MAAFDPGAAGTSGVRSSPKVFRCQKCAFFTTKYLLLLTHIGDSHSWESNFQVMCGIEGCPKTYSLVTSLKKHVYRKHRSFIGADVVASDACLGDTGVAGDVTAGPDSATASGAPPEVAKGSHAEEVCSDASETGSIEEPSPEAVTSDFVDRAKKKMCLFFLKLSEEHKVPHAVTECVMNDLKCLLEETFQQFSSAVRKLVPASAGGNSELEKLLNCNFIAELFSFSRSTYMRKMFAKKHLPYTAPQQLKFTPQSQDTFQYVPIGTMLKTTLEVPEVTNMVFSSSVSSTQQPNDVLQDFRDAAICKRVLNSIVGNSEVNTVFLILYADEVEICNPLGAKRGKHKLLLVYCSILNIHARYRSQLKAISLVLIAHYKDVCEHGIDRVLSPLVEDLQYLKDHGLELETSGGVIQVKVIVVAFCGDNLSLHSIGGFSAAFSKGRVCRFCMAHSDDIQNILDESMCVVREEHIHVQHVAAVAINEDLKRLYGVNKRSPLMSLDYFSVCTQLPPDVMHDIFEGTVGHVLRSVISGLLSDAVLSVDDLEKVNTFSYGYNDHKNRPEELTQSFLDAKGSLKGTASQKWCLFRLLPFMFSTQIPEDNPHWEVYLQFREIVDIVLAEEVPVAWVPYLKLRIKTFLNLFTSTYPHVNLTPKMHFMIHYPRIISELGPLTQFWCMRFEAKHQYFKRLASRVMNFRNVCKTLAERHQLLQAFQLCSTRVGGDVSSTGAKQVKREALAAVVQDKVAEKDVIWEVKSLTCDHSTYRQGDVLIMKKGEPPKFSLVHAIYTTDKEVLLLLVPLEILCFRRHRYSYHVKKSGELYIGSPGQEVSPQRLDIYFEAEVMPRCEIFV